MNSKIDNDVRQKVRELYASSQVAKDFLDWCADRQRDAKETTIERISSVIGVSRSEAVSLAKQLDAAGCGDFIVGRRGASSRFAWGYSRINLGRIAMGEVEELEEKLVDPLDDDLESETAQGLTIPQAKALLADSLGLEPSQIEINIRA